MLQTILLVLLLEVLLTTVAGAAAVAVVEVVVVVVVVLLLMLKRVLMVVAMLRLRLRQLKGLQLRALLGQRKELRTLVLWRLHALRQPWLHLGQGRLRGMRLLPALTLQGLLGVPRLVLRQQRPRLQRGCVRGLKRLCLLRGATPGVTEGDGGRDGAAEAWQRPERGAAFIVVQTLRQRRQVGDMQDPEAGGGGRPLGYRGRGHELQHRADRDLRRCAVMWCTGVGGALQRPSGDSVLWRLRARGVVRRLRARGGAGPGGRRGGEGPRGLAAHAASRRALLRHGVVVVAPVGIGHHQIVGLREADGAGGRAQGTGDGGLRGGHRGAGEAAGRPRGAQGPRRRAAAAAADAPAFARALVGVGVAGFAQNVHRGVAGAVGRGAGPQRRDDLHGARGPDGQAAARCPRHPRRAEGGRHGAPPRHGPRLRQALECRADGLGRCVGDHVQSVRLVRGLAELDVVVGPGRVRGRGAVAPSLGIIGRGQHDPFIVQFSGTPRVLLRRLVARLYTLAAAAAAAVVVVVVVVVVIVEELRVHRLRRDALGSALQRVPGAAVEHRRRLAVPELLLVFAFVAREQRRFLVVIVHVCQCRGAANGCALRIQQLNTAAFPRTLRAESTSVHWNKSSHTRANPSHALEGAVTPLRQSPENS